MAGTLDVLVRFDLNAPIKSLVELNRITGLASIHMNFDRPAQQKGEQPNGQLSLPAPQGLLPKPRVKGPGMGKFLVKGPEAITVAILAAGKPQGLKELQAAGVAAGRAATSISSNITRAKVEGWIELDNKGRWALTKAGRKHAKSLTKDERKAARAAKPKTAHKADRKPRAMVPGRTGADVIIDALKAATGPLVKRDLMNAFEKEGRSPASVGDQVAKCLEANVIDAVPNPTGAKGRGYVLGKNAPTTAEVH